MDNVGKIVRILQKNEEELRREELIKSVQVVEEKEERMCRKIAKRLFKSKHEWSFTNDCEGVYL